MQTFGYSLDRSQASPYQSMVNQENNGGPLNNVSVKCNYINLNKQCMITKYWERVYLILGDHVFKHMYKEYLIFLKTRDESLV